MKKFSYQLTKNDVIDFTLFIEDRKIVKFALNYRSLIDNKWCEIYRVDNYHGFLHEQKFWRYPKPILIEYEGCLNDIVKEYKNKIIYNFQQYREYFIRSKK